MTDKHTRFTQNVKSRFGLWLATLLVAVMGTFTTSNATALEYRHFSNPFFIPQTDSSSWTVDLQWLLESLEDDFACIPDPVPHPEDPIDSWFDWAGNHYEDCGFRDDLILVDLLNVEATLGYTMALLLDAPDHVDSTRLADFIEQVDRMYRDVQLRLAEF